jgi:alkylhydroperoxidase family enzyme
MFLGHAMTDAVLADWQTAAVDGKLRATLGFLRKLSLEPDAVTADDARAVLATGVSAQALADAAAVAAGFNTIVRMADTLGFEIPDQAGFAASAKALVRFGYIVG